MTVEIEGPTLRDFGNSAHRVRARRALPAPEPWELEVLRLLAEQQAIPFDQLARFLDCDEGQTESIVKHLTKRGCGDYGRFLADEPRWAWPTWRGMRLSGIGFRAEPPRLGAMARIRAVNEVRLHIARRAPEARWVCGRSVLRAQGTRGYRPNAVVEIGGERHALLVRFWATNQERTLAILETHMARYDAVIAFANRGPRALLERLKAEHPWPKLIIRAIPQPPLNVNANRDPARHGSPPGISAAEGGTK
ncbi:MAG: hypothetical protein WB507_10005 [Solirubrobacterales bacterium]